MRLTIDKLCESATELVRKLDDQIGLALAAAIVAADHSDEAATYEKRERVKLPYGKLENMNSPARK